MKMTFVNLAAAAGICAATSVCAGGYTAPVGGAAPEVVVVDDVNAGFDWSGAYGGATLGYGFSGDDVVGISQGQTRLYTSLGKMKLSGANYGLRAGYRTQQLWGERNWVIGAELGYDAGSVSDKLSSGGYTADVEMNSVLALRFKTGLLNQAGNTLFYGISGIARADFDYAVTGTAGAAGAVSIKDDGETTNGFIVGLGVERRFSDKWSMTGEWEYQRYDKKTLSDVNDRTTEATPDWHQIKLGVNYQF
ncbi:outer membrane immunogenic protein [Paracoccus isoporae]|uniref:Outer membrane immunogenic protein n=1 Tax=Paracoccus isoporae TaxID=591205 RepID=A0A1G6YPH9_9RHOB|nr:outer membrane beta-barrel protein [Paracoccus isoporae]SDD91446.1 outer membrane immunogenic protein [Paracoccus isoporae]